jgi:hypothetical protein
VTATRRPSWFATGTASAHPGSPTTRATVTEDDLDPCYFIIHTLWLGGSNPTFDRIQARLRPAPVDIVLAQCLVTLLERQWLKIQNIECNDDGIYERWYVPLRRNP